MSEPPNIVLNANQRRHFEVLLARLEDSLIRVGALLKPDGVSDRTLSLFDEDVPEGFRAPAEKALERMRAHIAELAVLLNLRPQRQSRRRAIAATLTSEAIRLEDSLSAQLRGYGALDPTVGQYLDPILSDMAATLATLARQAGRARGA